MKMFARAALAGSAIILSSVSLPSALAESPQRMIGEEIAARACAGCHGLAAPTGVTIQGVYVPSFSEIANRPNQSRDRLQSLITMPRHPMTSPALGDRELRQLAEYILSFKTH
jgi:mono/diheme cytochrome c family protein